MLQPEQAVIYVAGNPRLYPVEYYDGTSRTYRGVIPEFLGRFAREYGYELRYLEPGAEDRRAELAANQQVDLISGCLAGERYDHTAGEPILLFSEGAEGEETVYLLYVTRVAPQALRDELRDCAARTSQSQWTGELLRTVRETSAGPRSGGGVWGIALAAVLLCSVLAVLLSGCRRERRRQRRALLTDPETGLGTDEALSRAVTRLSGDQTRRFYDLICIHLDLDHVGWLRGWEQVSALVRHSARTVREHTQAADLPVRSASGDLLILKQFADSRQALDWAGEVAEKIRAFPGTGEALTAREVSAAVCPLEAEYQDLERLLFRARQCALAAGREEEPSARLCGARQCSSCRERWTLQAEFRQGLEREEFQLYLQFFVDAHTFRMVGGEALSRWKHPRLGLLGPDRYIPWLEEDGRISQLDLYCLEKSCAFLEDLDRREIRTFFLSCNISRRTFSMPGFSRQCLEIVQRYTFTRKLLILEVTESQRTNREQAGQMLENILDIRSSGMRVMFDDFGVGFSSFHDLQDYPMDGLKLDKMLVDNMCTQRGRILLRALVKTGHKLGMTILAEGVEEEEQIRTLRELRCDVLQGFRFSVPLPLEEARRRILEENCFKPEDAGGRETEG